MSLFTKAAAVALVVSSSALAVEGLGLVNSGHTFLGNAGRGGDGHGMQPELAAQTFVKVEEEWKAQAAVFAECNGTDDGVCSRAQDAFQRSCATVVGALVQASTGNRANAQEYMDDVCSQRPLDEWHRQQCSKLATTLVSSMSVVDVENREKLDAAGVCGHFWQQFSASERLRLEKEKEEALAREKEEAERRAAEEEARAKAEAERQAAEEEARKAEEEKRAREEEEEKRAREEEEKRAREEEEKKRAREEQQIEEAKAADAVAAEGMARARAAAKAAAEDESPAKQSTADAVSATAAANSSAAPANATADAAPSATADAAPTDAAPANATSANASQSASNATAANATAANATSA